MDEKSWHYNKVEELNRSITTAHETKDSTQRQWESDRADKVKMLRDVQVGKEDHEATKLTLQAVKDSWEDSEARMV